ncbi:RNA-directed DNA polymerase, eukaryota [Tanacetum coccineum]
MMWRSKVEGRANQVTHLIFVTNFPSRTSAKQLWDICEQYGKVVDSFILVRVSKEGKKFAIVRFPKVKNIEVKFPSSSTLSCSFVAAVSNEARPCSFDKQIEDKPVMVIDDDCLTNKKFNIMLVAKVKSFDSMPNLDSHARDYFQKHKGLDTWFSVVQQWKTDFKVDERVLWIDVEGVPLVAWTNKTFIKIAKRWGDMLFSEDSEDNNLWRKRLCVVTKVEDFIMESFKIIIKGKVSTVRARKIIGWTPDFMEEDNDSSSDSGDDVSDKSVSLNDFCASVKDNCSSVRDSKKERDAKKGFSEEEKSDDPFGIYNLLNHNDNKLIDGTMESEDVSKPPGFSNFIVEEKVASENDEGRVNSFNQVQENISNTKQNSNHVEIEQQVESNSNSVKGSHEPTPISHLFYTDDAVFIGEWREENLRHLVSCEASKIPFKYLGIMVGSNMNRLHAWDRVIEKVMARLSKWKAKTLSIGGRFTFLFKVIQRSLNCALLFKWIWRFKVQPNAMWVSIIKAIHGRSGRLLAIGGRSRG